MGGVNLNGNGLITPTATLGVSQMIDPFAGMPAPTAGSCQSDVSLKNHESKTINAGTYCSQISLTGQASLTLNPGLYILKGGLTMAGGTSLTSNGGVTFYIPSGSVSISAGATVNLTAQSTGNLQGILMWQDKNDTNAASLTGGAGQTLIGAVYFPSAQLTYTGGSTTNQTATTIAADTLSFVGNTYLSQAAQTNYLGKTGVFIVE